MQPNIVPNNAVPTLKTQASRAFKHIRFSQTKYKFDNMNIAKDKVIFVQAKAFKMFKIMLFLSDSILSIHCKLLLLIVVE